MDFDYSIDVMLSPPQPAVTLTSDLCLPESNQVIRSG